jgi:hypothetical protein
LGLGGPAGFLLGGAHWTYRQDKIRLTAMTVVNSDQTVVNSDQESRSGPVGRRAHAPLRNYT